MKPSKIQKLWANYKPMNKESWKKKNLKKNKKKKKPKPSKNDFKKAKRIERELDYGFKMAMQKD